ncbi:MAG TPA: ectonucleotide pyrophosphatase/phosphodiesterase [Bryobacteraceae bacterium]|nr:ectonucleotide pyrophosphatase/phosphodiesterase [Bryobacteraceae bacterium]
MTAPFSVRQRVAVCVLAIAGSSLAFFPPQVPENAPQNAKAQQNKPYVLIIGIDGMRYDYAERFGAKNLLALRERGSSSEALIPSFPSSTFPNFFTLATGLRPQNHGIVGMRFYDPDVGQEFFYQKTAPEGHWYSGSPIWSLAEQQGMRTAAFYWPGSEAEIQGFRPTYFRTYDGSVSHETRVRQVLQWLSLPEASRPHFVMLYFSDVDTAAHAHGPDSEEVRTAVAVVDNTIGGLLGSLQAIRPEVNVIVVSDHGLENCRNYIDITDDADLSAFQVVNQTTHAMLYSEDPARVERTYQQLRRKAKGRYLVYRRDETPRDLHFRRNRKIGDIVVIPVKPEAIGVRSETNTAAHMSAFKPGKGCHGFDAKRVPNMRGVFYAAGPQIRSGVRLRPIENVEVFPLLTTILGLEAPDKVDAKGILPPQLYLE